AEHGLRQEVQSQERVVAAAQQSLQLTRNQYEAGLIDYLSVVQVETNALSAQRALLNLQSELYISAIRLITALGGRWD
ncbi:TolC family protein, partial [Paenalcaligenes hominis]|uniref:TolC family protein n=1 Tax=Paenalcaligenes hominis TaxID=643674 RepID=UPI00361C0502